MKWTVQDIENLCKETCRIVGIEFDIPVKINGRLTSTLGRLCYKPSYFGEVIPDRIEISKNLLSTCSDETIREVIKHECCHYIVAIETEESHGHDKVFKEACARVGCRNNKSAAVVYEAIVANNKRYKYQVKCKCCDNTYNYHRATKAIKNINAYKCGKCGGELYVQQNW